MHPFDYLESEYGTKLIFTPCPGTKDTSIKDALVALKQAGATTVVTLLSDEELAALSVASLGKHIEQLGLNWFQLPIVDDAEPTEDFDTIWQQSKDKLNSLFKSGETIAIHCRGGSGRTALFACLLLMNNGESWESVQSKIREIRPKALTLASHLNYLNQRFSL